MSAKNQDTLNAMVGNLKGLSANEIRRMASAMMVEAAKAPGAKAKKETEEESVGSKLMPAFVSLKECVDALIAQYRLEVTKGSYDTGSLSFEEAGDKERHGRLVSERADLAGSALSGIGAALGEDASASVKEAVGLVGYSEPPTSEIGIRNVVAGLASALAGLKDFTDDKSARTAIKDAQAAIVSRSRPANVETQVATANLKAMAEVAAAGLADSFSQAHESGNSGVSEDARVSYAKFRSLVDEAIDKKSSIMIYATARDTAGQDKDKIHRGLYKISKNVLRGASLDNIGAVSVCEGLLMLLSAFKGGSSVGKAMKEISKVYEESSKAEESLENSAPSERKTVFLRKHKLMKAALDSKRAALQEDLRRYAGQPRAAEAEKELMAMNGGVDYGDLMNEMIDKSLGELHTERSLHDVLGAKHSRLLRGLDRSALGDVGGKDGGTEFADALARGDQDSQQKLLEGLMREEESKNDGEVSDDVLQEVESVMNALVAMSKRDPRAVQGYLSDPSKEGTENLLTSMSEARRAVGSRMDTYKALAEDDRERGIDRGPTGYGSHGLSIVPVSKVESEAEGDQQLQGMLARSKAHHFVRRKPWDAAVKDMLSNVKNLDGIRIKNNVFDPRKGAQEVLMWAKGMGGGVLRADVVDQAVKAQLKHYNELFEKGGDGKEGAKAEKEELLKSYDEEYQRLENMKEAESHVEEGWMHTARIVQEAREKHQDVVEGSQGELDRVIPKEQRDKLVSKQKEYGRRLYDKHFILHDKLQDHTVPGDLDQESLEDLLGLEEGKGTESLSDSDLAKLLASHMRGIESRKSRTEYKNNPSVTKPVKAPKSPVSGAAKAREHLKDVFGVLKAASGGTGVFSFNLREAAISNVGEYRRVPEDDESKHSSFLESKFDGILSGEDSARRNAFIEETRRHYHGIEDYGDAEESAAAGEEPLGDVLAKRHPLPGKLMRDAIGKIVRHDKALTHVKTTEPGLKVKRQRLVPENQQIRHFLPEKPVHTVSDELEDLRTLRSMYRGDLDIMHNPEHPYSRLRERLEDLQSAQDAHSSLHESKKSKVEAVTRELEEASARKSELEGKVNSGSASGDEINEHKQVSRKVDNLVGKKDQFERRAKQTEAYLSKLRNSIARTIQSIEGMSPDEKEATEALEAVEAHIKTLEGEVTAGKHKVGPNGEVPVYAKDIDELEENLFNTITEDLNSWKRKIAAQQKVVDDLADKIRTANKIAEEGLGPDAANIWAMELVGSMWQEIMNTWKSKKIQFGNLHQVDEIDWQDIMEVIKENVGLINDRALVSQLYELKELERALEGLLNSGKVHSKDTLRALLDKAAKLGGGKPFSEGTSERKLIEHALSGNLYDFKTLLDNLRMRKRLVWVKMNSLRTSREVVEVAKAVESVTKEVAPGKKIVDLKDAQDAVSAAKEAAASVNEEAADDQVQVSSEKKVPLTALGKLLVEALGW